MTTDATTTTAPEVPVPFALLDSTYPPAGHPDGELMDAVASVLRVVAARPANGSQGPTLEQDHWRCGTGQCTAGWVRALTGVAWCDEDDEDEDWVLVPSTRARFADEEGFESMPVSDYAQARLGITYPQAAVLFREHRTLPQILALLDVLARRPDAEYDELVSLCAVVDPWAHIPEREREPMQRVTEGMDFSGDPWAPTQLGGV